MTYEGSTISVVVFCLMVASTLGISAFMSSRTKSAAGYYAAHGRIHWFVNGIAFAGDYLSAASFLGTCGIIAFYGYDGFLYSIGYLSGWMVALFVVAEPLKRMGRFTFADALDSRFNSSSIRMAAALSTLTVSLFYLIPQMVGAGVLIRPLFGFPHYAGVVIVGCVVTLIVVTAGMVSTTWVQFIKGSMLVVFCFILTVAILQRGFRTYPVADGSTTTFAMLPAPEILGAPDIQIVPEEAGWKGKPYVRTRRNGDASVRVWRRLPAEGDNPERLAEAQTLNVSNGTRRVNGALQGNGPGQGDFHPVGHISRLPDGQLTTGSLGPFEFFRTLADSEVVLWNSQAIVEADGTTTAVYYPTPTPGHHVLVPGLSPTFQGLRANHFTWAKLDFMSLMLALFCGTASLPHILIRYYTVKDQEAVRRSTVVGIASIGFFYVMTLYLGYGAMVGHILDPTDSNMATPLLARSFGELPFAIISAIAFTTVLGTVSGLIIAASGAVAHDLMTKVFARSMNDREKVKAGKITAIVVGVVAMALGILCKDLNTGFLVGWAFNVAASANLAALVMALFWKGATRQGITASIGVGLCSSLGWILLSGDTYSKVYGWSAADAPVPFSQPAIVSIPLAFIVLIGVSLATRRAPAVR